jgi:hypothetical protein
MKDLMTKDQFIQAIRDGEISLGEIINSTTFRPEKVAISVANDHRYLQNTAFMLCCSILERLAIHNFEGNTDMRNSDACKMAEKIIHLLRDTDHSGYYPITYTEHIRKGNKADNTI